MNRRLIASILAAASVAALSVSPAFAQSRHAGSITLNGIGSSADAPLFAVAFNGAHYSYNGSAVSATYNPAGSGGGQKSLASNCGQTGGVPGNWDWGSWDVAQGIPGDSFCDQSKITQFPITAFGAAIITNLPQKVQSDLRLTGGILDGIFTGGITTWGNKAIQKVNPQLLPAKKKGKKKKVCDAACKAYKGVEKESITPVVRSDSSGTTFAFTSYLCSLNGAYKTKYGTGPICPSKLPSWTWTAGSKSAGLDAVVQQTPGAIGYVETFYASQNNETPAYIRNAAGKFVQPTVADVASDVANGTSSNFDDTYPNFVIVNAGGKNSYPISTYSWTGLYTKGSDGQDSSNCGATKAAFQWFVSAKGGQKYAANNGYAPLASAVTTYAENKLKNVNC